VLVKAGEDKHCICLPDLFASRSQAVNMNG